MSLLGFAPKKSLTNGINTVSKNVAYLGMAVYESKPDLIISAVRYGNITTPELKTYMVGQTAIFSCGKTRFGLKLKSIK